MQIFGRKLFSVFQFYRCSPVTSAPNRNNPAPPAAKFHPEALLEMMDHSLLFQADAPLLIAVKSTDPAPAHVNTFVSKIIHSLEGVQGNTLKSTLMRRAEKQRKKGCLGKIIKFKKQEFFGP